MTNLEIKTEIDTNNLLIETLMDPSAWTLNNSIATLQKRNKMLQQECTHHFVDKVCEYCYKTEDSTDE